MASELTFYFRSWLNALTLALTLARVRGARWLLVTLTDVATVLALGAGLLGLLVWRALTRLGSVG